MKPFWVSWVCCALLSVSRVVGSDPPPSPLDASDVGVTSEQPLGDILATINKQYQDLDKTLRPRRFLGLFPELAQRPDVLQAEKFFIAFDHFVGFRSIDYTAWQEEGYPAAQSNHLLSSPLQARSLLIRYRECELDFERNMNLFLGSMLMPYGLLLLYVSPIVSPAWPHAYSCLHSALPDIDLSVRWAYPGVLLLASSLALLRSACPAWHFIYRVTQFSLFYHEYALIEKEEVALHLPCIFSLPFACWDALMLYGLMRPQASVYPQFMDVVIESPRRKVLHFLQEGNRDFGAIRDALEKQCNYPRDIVLLIMEWLVGPWLVRHASKPQRVPLDLVSPLLQARPLRQKVHLASLVKKRYCLLCVIIPLWGSYLLLAFYHLLSWIDVG